MSFPQYVHFFRCVAMPWPISHTFPRWLGQNSKQNKLARQLSDVQIRMRLKVSGDKAEIRQSYIPALYPHIVEPLIDDGSVSIAIRFLPPL